jgi:hypothetical protein
MGPLPPLMRITTEFFVREQPGGSGKAEGFADGGWTKPSASWRLPLPPDHEILKCNLYYFKHRTSHFFLPSLSIGVHLYASPYFLPCCRNLSKKMDFATPRNRRKSLSRLQ